MVREQIAEEFVGGKAATALTISSPYGPILFIYAVISAEELISAIPCSSGF
jgi:hypothetical protein